MPPPEWVRHALWWQVYPLGFGGCDVTGGDRSPGRPNTFERLLGWLDYAVRMGASGIALGPVFESSTHGYDTVDHYRVDTRLGGEEDFAAFCADAHRRGLRVLLDGVFNHVGTGFAAGDGRWLRRHDGTPATFEGHPGLLLLDHSNEEVAAYVAGVMRHWLGRGADGWRLDAAYAVDPSFWAAVLPAVRREHPDAWFVGEVIHGDYRAYVEQSGLDSVTQYELWKAVWSSLNDRNLFELAWALDRHNGMVADFLPLTFVGNHDVTRIASRLGDRRRLAQALVVLFTVGGVPSVYYGDEQAFEGVKEDRPGGDDAVRPAFPEAEDQLAPWGWDVYRLHQDLIGLRRRHPWLASARVEPVSVGNRQMVYDAVAADGRSHLQVALNLDDEAMTAPGAGPVEPHGWAISAD